MQDLRRYFKPEALSVNCCPSTDLGRERPILVLGGVFYVDQAPLRAIAIVREPATLSLNLFAQQP